MQNKLLLHFPHIDTVKSLALISVIVIHAAAPVLSEAVLFSSAWYAALLLRSLAAAAVPLFFMCTGALFLRHDKPLCLRAVWGKYILKITLCLLFWAALYEVFDLVRLAISGNVTKLDIYIAAKRLLCCQTHFHLYYLYIVLLLYALMPLLRELVHHLSLPMTVYLLVLWATVGILWPFLRQFAPFTLLSGIPQQYALNMTWSSAGYCVLGYILSEHPTPRRLFPVIASFAGFCGVFCGTVWHSLRCGNFSTIFLEGMTPAVALLAVGVFSLCRNFSLGKQLSSVTCYLAGASFCVYLVHDFFNIILRHCGLSGSTFFPLFSIPLVSLLVLIGSLAVHAILSRIPWVRRWLI